MSLGVAVAGLLVLSLSAVGCRESRRARAELLELEEPATERLDPAVRTALERARQEVRLLIVDESVSDETLGAAYGELGRRYHAVELHDTSVPCYANAQSLVPGDHRWPYYLGHVYRSLYDLERARVSFERVRELRPHDVPTLVALAEIHLEERRFEEAAVLAREALERQGDSAGAMLVMADLATVREEPAQAAEWYEKLLTAQPGATRFYQPLAMAYRALGQREKAEEALRLRGEGRARIEDPLLRALTAHESVARRHAVRGVAAFGRGDFQAAEAAFRSAVEADPGDLAARLNLGSALTGLQRYAEAVETYREVLERDSSHTAAHFNLGVVLGLLGEARESRRYYREALRIDADYADPRYNLANSLRHAGRCDEAVEHFRRVTELAPDNGSARLGEVFCLAATARFEGALVRLEEGMRVLPSNLGLVKAAARILAACPEAEIRDGDRAVELSRRLVAERPGAESLETLAMALAEVGRHDEAARIQREAITEAGVDRGSELFDRLSRTLERYEQGEPCRDPHLDS